MVVARAIGRAILWLLLGFTGSLVILIVTTRIIDIQGYPRLQSGGLVFVDYWDRGYVQASGTWVFEGDTKQAFPRQTTEIKCYRDEKQCRAAQAEIAFDMLTVQTEILIFESRPLAVGRTVHNSTLRRQLLMIKAFASAP